MAKDWDTSQLVNQQVTESIFGTSAAVTTNIPPSSSYLVTVKIAAAAAGDPVAVSSDKDLGTAVSVYARSVAGAVEIRIRNFSTTISLTLISVVFKATVIKEI